MSNTCCCCQFLLLITVYMYVIMGRSKGRETEIRMWDRGEDV